MSHCSRGEEVGQFMHDRDIVFKKFLSLIRID